MSVFETIKKRRSLGMMTQERPSRQQIARLLEAATHAPNHHKVEPWKFIVLAGKAREDLGIIMAESLASHLDETASNKAQARLNKERTKLLRSPVVIAVVAQPPRLPNVLEIENLVCRPLLVKKKLLAAVEIGHACMWRNGD